MSVALGRQTGEHPAPPKGDSRRLTHMWGFWKGGPAVLSVNLAVGLMGGLAKFSFRALRLPEGGTTGDITTGSAPKAEAAKS